MGRAAHSDLTGDVPLAPSAIAQSRLVEVADYQKKPAQTPKAMDANDIKETLAWYRIAAENALRELDKPIVIIPNVITLCT